MNNLFIHPQSIVETSRVGKNTRIWAFTHLQEDVSIGEDCNVGENCFIESGVTIGDRVIIKNGTSVWSGVRIQNDVFIGPNVVFTNERFPRSGFRKTFDSTLIQKGVSVGANATILCGLVLERFSTIGAGSVLTRSTCSHGLYCGNPARLHGFVCRCGLVLAKPDAQNRMLCQCGLSYKANGENHIEEITE